MTSRPFTPDTIAKLREKFVDLIQLTPSTWDRDSVGRMLTYIPQAHAEGTADAMIAILTPLLDATHEAACRAMREEAAKAAASAWMTADYDDIADADLAQNVSEHAGSKILAIPIPKREG